MVEMMFESTFKSSNVHGVVDDNSNRYTIMVIDIIGMNQGYTGECLIIDEEQNIDATRSIDFLKNSDKPL
jgi:hypothetical protein